MCGKIIVIDDEHSWREGLKSLLEEDGYTVDTARSANKAIKKLKKYIYDLAIIDLRMPNEIGEMDDYSGIKLCEKLDSQNYILPIIILTVLTGRDDKVISKRCKKYFNIKSIITKDAKYEEIKKEINNFMTSIKKEK